MSASRERRYRQSGGGNKKSSQREPSGKTTLYWIGGIAAALLAVAAVVWNTGMIQGGATALTVGSQSFSTPYVQYYYRNAYLNASYYAQYGLLDFDPAISAKKQLFDAATGETYHDYFLSQAKDAIIYNATLYQDAQANGFVLPEAGQKMREETLASLHSQALAEGVKTADRYLKTQYGQTMNEKVYEGILDLQLLASYYAQEYMDSISYAQSDLETYYTENKDSLDYYDLTVFTFRAEVESQYDESGKLVERTDEEQAAALEEAKTAAKAQAESAQAALADGGDAHELEEDFDAYDVLHDRETAGASLNTYYADWVKSAQRQPGDTTLAESDGGTTYNYYAVRYEGRRQDTGLAPTVRHILVEAEMDEGATTPTDEQYDVAKATAEELLAQWKAGPATAESFGQMALEYSADTGSAQDGGLIREILPESSYIDGFKGWALDGERKIGDTGLVQNTGSGIMGWHIMYFDGYGRPNWQIRVENTLKDQDYTQWQEKLAQSAQVTEGAGMSFVK